MVIIEKDNKIYISEEGNDFFEVVFNKNTFELEKKQLKEHKNKALQLLAIKLMKDFNKQISYSFRKFKRLNSLTFEFENLSFSIIMP
jgi:hypothetical protein